MEQGLIISLLSAVLLGLVPAFIASSKGRSFIGFWIYGTLIFIAALPHALLMKADAKTLEADALADGGRKCPHCAEVVKAEANVCRFCQRELPPISSTVTSESLKQIQLMEKYGITHDDGTYHFRGYKYESLSDAVIYAARIADKKHIR